MKTIPKRLSTALINSLSAGVVPRIGLEQINVGRKKEIEVILNDLENTGEGAAFCRFLIGKFGSGKSFLLQLIRNYAMDRNFLVADADLSPERRFSGSKGQGLATYRELMRNLATKTRPDGGSLPAVLDRWISRLQGDVMQSDDIAPGSPEMTKAVEKKILAEIHQIEGLVHGFDFGMVLAQYWRGYQTEQDELKDAALRWFRGEFSTKTEARDLLGVRVIIDDESWYDYLKIMSNFIANIGYKGLIVFIDEAVNLYKITHSVSRVANYEKLLSMYNDTLQGKASHLGILIGGTPLFLEDPRRGLYSYDALKTRLMESRFLQEGMVDLSNPVIRLHTLSQEELYVLLTRLSNVHSSHYQYKSQLTEQDYQEFIQEAFNRVGADKHLTPREIIRDFLTLLNLLQQNPGTTLMKILKGKDFTPTDFSKPGKTGEKETLPEYAEFSL